MFKGKQIFLTLLYALAFWTAIGGLIILCSYLLFKNSGDKSAYDITGAQQATPLTKAIISSIAPDAHRGALIFQQCAVCHSLTPKAAPAIGPNLGQIIGRKIAAITPFYYSQAMRDFAESHKIWTPALLDKYIAEPQTVVPGNRMGFYGLKSAKDRADLLLYLSEAARLQ